MNYLAHLSLSCQDDELMIGNFIADFVKNKYLDELTPRVLQGIKLHRKIDSFTDTHPVVRESVRHLQPIHRKYAGVIVDILYDYFLFLNWNTYNELPLAEFKSQVYRTLLERLNLIPQQFHHPTKMMVKDDWLSNYTTIDGLEKTFNRVKRRVSKPVYFENITTSLLQYHDDLEEEFKHFFPELKIFVVEQCNCF